MNNLLEIQNLRTHFHTEDGVVPAVDGVTFAIRPGETLGVVGESGCGKSVTGLSILRLVPNPPGKILPGSRVMFNDQDLLSLSEKEMRQIRGNEISMIFQEPMTSLNPVFTIGLQISETLQLHQGMNPSQAKEKSIEMLKKVGIPRPEKVVDDYPHALSGGMRQRVMIAMALACNPRLIIADEPTTALDVTIQAQILELMKDLRDSFNTAIMLITHDLGVIAEMAQRVVVMYAGKVVEQGDVESIFENPLHPYTHGLLHSIPKIEGAIERLESVPGLVPNPLRLPTGCLFEPRCSKAMERCRQQRPGIKDLGEGRQVSCWLYC